MVDHVVAPATGLAPGPAPAPATGPASAMTPQLDLHNWTFTTAPAPAQRDLHNQAFTCTCTFDHLHHLHHH
eukprot:3288089-Karenia_brevis.AAC.1